MLKNMKPFAALRAVAIPPITLAGFVGPQKVASQPRHTAQPTQNKDQSALHGCRGAADAMSPKTLDMCL